jgi:Bacterial low temperature requirement A protein (LtrA)
VLESDQRLLLWIPALALELAAPAAGYWLPGRGRAATTDYDIEGTHFAERCQVFILIALGESIVVTGATASATGSHRPSCSASSSRSPRPLRCGGCTSVRQRSTRASRSALARTPVASRATHTPTLTCRSSRASLRPRSATTCSSRPHTQGAGRDRRRDDPRRARALPTWREPVRLADDPHDECQTRRGRRTARRAGAARWPDQRPPAQPHRRVAAADACGLGAARVASHS